MPPPSRPTPARTSNNVRRQVQGRTNGRKPAPRPQPAPPPPPKKDDEAALRTMKIAEKVLQELREEDHKEGFAKAAKKVAGGKLGWKAYIKPMDGTNIEECASVDEYNQSVQELNNANAPAINELMKELGRPPVHVDPPQKYKAIALRKKEEMLFDKNYRIMAGVSFLAKRDIFPVRDYEIIDAPVLADDVAAKEEAQRIIAAAGEDGISIAKAVGVGHANNCTCENRWDGASERCKGGGARMQWRKLKNHHFLRPVIEPETW